MRSASDRSLDPFFEAVRRRHPDVDLVVLPPASELEDEGEPVGDDVLAESALTLSSSARSLCRRAGWPVEDEPVVRYRFGHGPASVRPQALGRTDGDTDAVDRLLRVLDRDGWVLDDRPAEPDTGRPRMVEGRREQTDLTIRQTTGGALTLSMTAASLLVGAERARRLTRDGGR